MFTLKNDSYTLDCFTWQKPGELSFNCFDIMNVFYELTDKNDFCEFLIRCEGIEFSALTEINITLDILSNN